MNPIALPSPPKRILIIKPSSLGDVVHTLPILNLLRRKWPEAHISWLIGSAFAGLLEGHPQLNELIPFDRRRFASWWQSPSALGELIRFNKDLSRREFDLVLDLQGLLRSGWLTWLTKAPVRVGFANAREAAHVFYTHRIPVRTMDQHAVERYLSVTEALGCGRAPVEFNFVVKDSDRAHVDALVKDVGPFALLLPGTNWPTKRWPVEHFAQIIEPLQSQRGLSTVVGGSTDASEFAEHLTQNGKPDLRLDSARHGKVLVRSAVGKTTLPQLVALIERASLVIANDSGPMHIASALNKPLVSLFGPTNPIRTGPHQRLNTVVRVDIACSPCYSRTCSHTSCMKWISPEAVMKQAERMTNQ